MFCCHWAPCCASLSLWLSKPYTVIWPRLQIKVLDEHSDTPATSWIRTVAGTLKSPWPHERRSVGYLPQKDLGWPRYRKEWHKLRRSPQLLTNPVVSSLPKWDKIGHARTECEDISWHLLEWPLRGNNRANRAHFWASSRKFNISKLWAKEL